MDSDFGDVMASMSQFRNRLDNRRSKDDKMSRRMWKAMETSSREVGLGETEKGGSKERSRKKIRGKREEKEIEERKDGRS